MRMAGGAFTASATPFKALRERKLVRQGWDNSCGAAALSTILTYHYGVELNEATIALSILHNTDPDRVRRQGGFTLLDLKRFVEAIGLEASGYAGLTIDDLDTFEAPLILPTRIRNFDHFVVYRGSVGDRVLLGDPAFGNLSMTRSQLLDIWHGQVGFVVRADAGFVADRSLLPDELDLAVPDLKLIGRLIRGQGPAPATRRRVIVDFVRWP